MEACEQPRHAKARSLRGDRSRARLTTAISAISHELHGKPMWTSAAASAAAAVARVCAPRPAQRDAVAAGGRVRGRSGPARRNCGGRRRAASGSLGASKAYSARAPTPTTSSRRRRRSRGRAAATRADPCTRRRPPSPRPSCAPATRSRRASRRRAAAAPPGRRSRNGSARSRRARRGACSTPTRTSPPATRGRARRSAGTLTTSTCSW